MWLLENLLINKKAIVHVVKCHGNKEEGEEAFVNMITPKDSDGRSTPYTTWLGMEGPKRKGWIFFLTSS
jgi:hypothetical protein